MTCFSCVCGRGGADICVCVCACARVHTSGQRRMSYVLPYHSLASSLGSRSLTEPGAILAAESSREPSYLYSPQCWVQVQTAMDSAVHGFWGPPAWAASTLTFWAISLPLRVGIRSLLHWFINHFLDSIVINGINLYLFGLMFALSWASLVPKTEDKLEGFPLSLHPEQILLGRIN